MSGGLEKSKKFRTNIDKIFFILIANVINESSKNVPAKNLWSFKDEVFNIKLYKS